MKTRTSRKIKKTAATVLLYLAVIIVLLWTMGPLLWMAVSSIMPGREMLESGTRILPSAVTLERYAVIFGIDGQATQQALVFRRSILNSVIVAGVSTLFSIVFGSVAAYAFSRLMFKGKKALLFVAMFFQLLPPISLLVPYYIMGSRTGMVGHIITLIIIDTNFILAYVIWVMNGYYKSIPRDLEEAGRIDGCTRFGVFWRIIVPTAAPGFVAVGALSFLMAWDEFLYALVFSQSDSAKTIPVAVSEFSTKYGVDYGMMMTSGVVATIIPLLLALFFQRYIVSGLTSGAVKE